MNLVLGVMVVVSALLTAFVGATAFSLRSSDAAGNGLAQVYLAFSVIALWLLIGVMFLVALSRPFRQPIALGPLNLVTFVLFIGAAAGQLATLQVLSGSRVEGVGRLVMQLAVIVVPLSAIVFVAWRGLSMPVPSWMATRLAASLVVLFSVAPLWGILRPVSSPVVADDDPLAQLTFPVVIIHDLAFVVVSDSAANLRMMRSSYVTGAKSEPYLIDSRLQIFVLRDLRIDKGATGLNALAQGMEAVSFRLVDWEPDGTPEAVHNILLRTKSFSADPAQDEATRKKVTAESTLDGMIRAIREP